MRAKTEILSPSVRMFVILIPLLKTIKCVQSDDADLMFQCYVGTLFRVMSVNFSVLCRYNFSCYFGTLFRVVSVHFSVLFRYTFPCYVGTIFRIM